MKGDFTVFGFTPHPAALLDFSIPQRLGVAPRRLAFGDAGALFFHSTYAEMAETEDAVAIKLGFLRAPDGAPLSAEALLRRGIVSPQHADHERMLGNALVACLSKRDPLFSVYKTLLGVPQLYYAVVGNGLICADRLAALTTLLDGVELDEAALPMHFLFRSTPGEQTYYRGVRRMPSGAHMLWKDRDLVCRQQGDLSFNGASGSLRSDGPQAQDELFASLQSALTNSVAQAEAHDQPAGMLLSGGIDSSLLQHILAAAGAGREQRSYSYAVQAVSFAGEIEAAGQAAEFFGTRHTFIELGDDDFPALLVRTVEHLAQPPVLETEPCMLAVAERAEQAAFTDRHFISGQGADALFGLNFSKKLQALHWAGCVPAAPHLLHGLSLLAKPFGRSSAMLHKAAEILKGAGDADLLIEPANSVAVYSDINLVCRCFGEKTVRAALQQRRAWANRFMHSNHYLEKVHLIDLVTDAYEVDLQRRQLFLAHRREQIHPFFDDEVLRAGFRFHPDVRYIKGWQPKHLLKSLLERKTNAPAARRPKGFSIFEAELMQWMGAGGSLRPLVEAIERPSFLSRADFDQLLQAPDYFLWGLLTYDIFQKQVRSRQPIVEYIS